MVNPLIMSWVIVAYFFGSELTVGDYLWDQYWGVSRSLVCVESLFFCVDFPCCFARGLAKSKLWVFDKSINILIYVLFLFRFCRRIRFKKGLLLHFSDFQLFCALRRFLRKNQLFGGILAQGQLEMKANTLKFNLWFF